MQVLATTTTNTNAVLAQNKHRQSCSVQFIHVVYCIQLCGVLVHRYQITSPICERGSWLYDHTGSKRQKHKSLQRSVRSTVHISHNEYNCKNKKRWYYSTTHRHNVNV